MYTEAERAALALTEEGAARLRRTRTHRTARHGFPDRDAPREPVRAGPTSDTCQHHPEDTRQHLTMTTAGGDAQEWV